MRFCPSTYPRSRNLPSNVSHTSPGPARVFERMPRRYTFACCVRALTGHVAMAAAAYRTNTRRLVCLERSIVRCDGGRVISRPPPWLEARARLGCQTASELGAPAISSIPGQLPGHEPASARMGYEDERILQCRDRRFDGSFGCG